jgi:plastocyanin
MLLKRLSLLLPLTIAAVLVSAVAPVTAAPGKASVVIRHQVRGCHTWAVNGGAFKASQSVTLRRGATLVVTDNDVMPHKLVLTSGPALRLSHPLLAHMGASLEVTLTRPGVYRFTTKAGEDYPSMSGMKTIGEDNVLKLTVVVS